MKKIFASISVFIFAAFVATAQTDEDALRYSQQTFGGTARGVAVGGAFGALGSDFTSLSINPAGVGFYRSNEFMFTPGFAFINSSSEFKKNTNEDRKTNFNISNFGFAWTHLYDEKKVKGWKSISFAFGANRVANYHNSVFYKGFNDANSLMNSYLDNMNSNGGVSEANLESYFPFDADLAFKTKLVAVQGNDTWGSPLANGGLQQSKNYTARGSITEYVATLGANYNNKLFLGATLGIPSLRYKYEGTYTENDINDSINDFNSFTLSNNLTTSGIGVNVKLGMIYKANDYFRIGAAIHSPTYFSMADKYSSRIESSFTTGTYDEKSPDGIFNYALTTPWKLVGSAAVLFKKYGFISVDYEYLDYSEAFYNFNQSSNTDDKDYENEQNNLINTKYTGAGNLKVGGELVLDIFRLRAGYAMFGTPMKSNIAVAGFDNASTHYTAGFGFREDNYFLDFGFVHSISHSYELAYTLPAGQEVPGAKITTSSNQYVMTLGFKF